MFVYAIKLLKQAKHGFPKVDEDLEDFLKEIEALCSVNNLIKCSFEADPATTTHGKDQQIIVDHWEATRTTLANCREITERLNDLGVGKSPALRSLDLIAIPSRLTTVPIMFEAL